MTRKIRLRRGAAAALDAALALVVGVLLAGTAGHRLAALAAVTLRVGRPGTFWHGPLPMVLGLAGNLVYGLPLAVLLVQGAELAGGVTPGKALLGLWIVARDTGMPPSPPRFLSRWFLKNAGPLLMVAGLLARNTALFVAGTSLALIEPVGLLLSLTVAGGVGCHDRLSGTRVVSQ